jgi:hypothetical protein
MNPKFHIYVNAEFGISFWNIYLLIPIFAALTNEVMGLRSR